MNGHAFTCNTLVNVCKLCLFTGMPKNYTRKFIKQHYYIYNHSRYSKFSSYCYFIIMSHLGQKILSFIMQNQFINITHYYHVLLLNCIQGYRNEYTFHVNTDILVSVCTMTLPGMEHIADSYACVVSVKSVLKQSRLQRLLNVS